MTALAVSQVLAPADAAVWAKNQPANEKRPAQASHRCTDTCQPYTGPVRLGRDGEQITPGRP